MKRGFGIASCVLAVLVFVLGLVLKNQADFARDYVHDQLAAHAIYFTPEANLLPPQKGVACLVDNAEKPLLTGKQAECYANYQIGIDLTLVDNGKTYFEDHYNGYLSRVKAAEALAANPDDPATAELVKAAVAADRRSDDLLAGEATRGLLLTAYGFSVIGDRTAQAAYVCFILAGLLLIVGIVLIVLGGKKDKSATPAAATPAPAES